ncbi:MAG TPA: LLM class flavin-dependent oxidoreductase, partial [Candidatus Binatia bacterium]|nr:LLM class flavin-dependent oxidoreductase [Candidatus Binatia bacterium]
MGATSARDPTQICESGLNRRRPAAAPRPSLPAGRPDVSRRSRRRPAHVTPAPYRPGGPSISLGGSSERAARRAARIADGFLASVPEVWEFYRDEVQQLGRRDPGASPIGQNRVVALAEDPEKGWEQMAPFFLHET